MSPAEKPAETKKPEATNAQPQESIVATSATKKTSGLAVAALVLAFFFPVVGFILGIVALSSIKKNNESGRGLAISAIVISVILTLVGLLTMLIFGLAINKAANETTASASIPSGFPSDVPIYKPSDVIFYTLDGDYSVELLSTDSEAKVRDYYSKQLSSNGWVTPQGGEAIVYPGGVISQLEKDGNLSLVIWTDDRRNDGKTLVKILVGPKSSNNK